MKYIIDGYNLMYKLEITATEMQGRRAEMTELLLGFLENNPGKMTVVFDAPSTESTLRHKENHGTMLFVFAAKGETADDIILELIKNRQGKAKEHIVVSSDDRLRDAAIKEHMKVLKSEEFVEYL